MDLSTLAGFKGWMEITNPDDPNDKVIVYAAKFDGGGVTAETGSFADHDRKVPLEGEREREAITISQGLGRSTAMDVAQKLDRWVGSARCTATRAEMVRGKMQPYPWKYTGILNGCSQSARDKGESGGAELTLTMSCDPDLA